MRTVAGAILIAATVAFAACTSSHNDVRRQTEQLGVDSLVGWRCPPVMAFERRVGPPMDTGLRLTASEKAGAKPAIPTAPKATVPSGDAVVRQAAYLAADADLRARFAHDPATYRAKTAALKETMLK